MNRDDKIQIAQRARILNERVLSELRESGRIDRRDFLRFGALSLSSVLLAACGSQGPDFASNWLKVAEKKNENVERWLFSHTRMNRGSPGAKVAGMDFPAYFVSKEVPKWDDAVRGAWSLSIGGAVRKPITLSLEQLVKMPRIRQRVDHFCVEGWTAVEILSGVRLSDLANMVELAPDASYVDFASFDDDYHESWDIDSALHPQTIIVYAKEDAYLSPWYGAPARVHSPVKLGYKNTKYLTKITFMPERNGGYWSDKGYEWYGGT